MGLKVVVLKDKETGECTALVEDTGTSQYLEAYGTNSEDALSDLRKHVAWRKDELNRIDFDRIEIRES